MARYRSRPVEIEAVQWFPGVEHPGVKRYAISSTIICEDPFTLGEPREWVYYVTTMHEQHVNLTPGDWIIAEPIADRFYPCKPDVFERKYDLVES